MQAQRAFFFLLPPPPPSKAMSTNLDELGGSCIIPNVHNYPRDTDYDGYNDTRTHDTEGRDVRMPSGRSYQEGERGKGEMGEKRRGDEGNEKKFWHDVCGENDEAEINQNKNYSNKP